MEKIEIILSDQEILLKCVSNFQKIPISILAGKSRQREIIYARHAYCYVCNVLLRLEKAYNKTSVSYSSIAELIAKDHATVMHGYREIQNRVDTERVIKFKIEILMDKCRKELIRDSPEQKIITDFSSI